MEGSGSEARAARRLTILGRVQGVGYRPFLYRTAQRFNLAGWARNGSGQVFVHVEGRSADLARFEEAAIAEAPPLARPRLAAAAATDCEGRSDFRILHSEDETVSDVHLPPDLFLCEDCLEELRTLTARRHRYPFINCTQCGPRYTIIAALPYDRPNTSMKEFALCDACRRDYEDPLDRRFHAQPLACPDCGPSLSFHARGRRLGEGEEALARTVALLRIGGIVAVKGIGGYHLLCDAANEAAVVLLRARKRRPHKPLAVMFPLRGADGLETVADSVDLSELEARALVDVARPIVLARRRRDCGLAMSLAPGLDTLGCFLPYSPLHHLLLQDFGGALVATSGNVSGEPVITDDSEAERRLAAVADAFLHHDRAILRPADDSVRRVIAGKARPLRLGRGVAPLERELPGRLPAPVLAVGGQMKVTVALAWQDRVVVSPHIGDLDSPRSLDIFERVIGDLQRLYDVAAESIVCDLHPAYASTRWALRQGKPVHRVQHHRAHASALAGEHPQLRRWLVFAWDGVGHGGDGTLWGGEALLGGPGRWQRVASLRPFHLPAGDRAAREPWRSAAALMWEESRHWMPAAAGAPLVAEAWRKRVNTVPTSSAGRLFDAAASLVLGLDQASFEGQGPMSLESIAGDGGEWIELPLAADDHGILRCDWAPLLPLLSDQTRPAAERAAIFHESLAHAIGSQAMALRGTTSFDAVGLVGGVFQNRRLAERVIELLGQADMPVYLPVEVPANDGGLAFGQIVETLAEAASWP